MMQEEKLYDITEVCAMLICAKAIIYGDTVFLDKIAVDKQYPNKIYQYIKYTKIGLRITFVFYDRKIDDLWFHYYNMKAR
ncbi:MAG: hypothetical protein IJ489_09075 [Clostridia bacterium]|nr:hypothetical protein [Clostridia bacterium]